MIKNYSSTTLLECTLIIDGKEIRKNIVEESNVSIVISNILRIAKIIGKTIVGEENLVEVEDAINMKVQMNLKVICLMEVISDAEKSHGVPDGCNDAANVGNCS